LLQLTGNRVGTSYDNVKQIQEILSSTPRLYEPHELPKIQSINSNEEAITGHMLVFDNQDKMQGLLKIQVSFSDFKAILGNTSTLSFAPLLVSENGKNQLLQNEPFALYAKSPYSFWEFIFSVKDRYEIFVLYTVLLLFLFALCWSYLHQRMKVAYRNNFKNLKAKLSKSTLAEEQANERAIIYEQKYKSYKISAQVHRKIQDVLNTRQREQLHHISHSLNIIKQSLTDVGSQLSPKRHMEIIRSCLDLTYLLSKGLIAKTKKEPINLYFSFKNFMGLKLNLKSNNLAKPLKIISRCTLVYTN